MIKSVLERVLDQFEKDSKRIPVYLGGAFNREAREYWPKQRYYENGRVNEIFTVYLAGYAYGKCAERATE